VSYSFAIFHFIKNVFQYSPISFSVVTCGQAWVHVLSFVDADTIANRVGLVSHPFHALATALLLGLGKVTQQEVNRQRDAIEWGKGSFMYAWCSDRTDAERQRGISTRAIIISSINGH